MADNSRKKPLGQSLNVFAEGKIRDAIQILGKALPASVVKVQGQIVTVKFEVQSGFTLPQVKMPIMGAEYVRMPTQLKDKGYVIPADVYLGGMSGLGGGVADLTQRANLSALVFFPIGNQGWTLVDPNAVTVYGPNGVCLRDTNSGAVITLTPTGINLQVGGVILNINGSQITVTGKLVINGIVFDTHEHTGVQTGGGKTGAPTNP